MAVIKTHDDRPRLGLRASHPWKEQRDLKHREETDREVQRKPGEHYRTPGSETLNSETASNYENMITSCYYRDFEPLTTPPRD